MRICPKCRTAYPDRGRTTCARDGTKLVDAREFSESQSDPTLGKTIGGRFLIEERIGIGGMGTVYRATQTGLDRQVALKILKKELNWDNDTVTRFHREARAMSLLTHANTVRVFDFGETEDGLLYFAMELLDGELLTSRIERDGALDVVAAIRITQQILRSLAEAHSKGIIHRDLKPDNIYLASVEGHIEPVVKVLDFGIAKIVLGERKVDQLETQAGTVFGTPRYMSPEQAQGKSLDPRSDLYSVGTLLYQLLCGHAPFVDDDAVVVMAKHIRERPEPLRRAAPDRPIPASLERAVTRAIEKDPARRFRDAERFAAKLESCVSDAAAMGTGNHQSLAGFVRDLPRVPIAIAALVVAMAVGVSLYLVSSSGEASAGEVDALGRGGAAGPPSSTPAAPVRTATSTVVSEPEGAEVWWEGSMLGTTPYTVRRPLGSGMDLELRLEGFVPARALVVADGSTTTVRLERHGSTTPGPRIARDRTHPPPRGHEQQQGPATVAPPPPHVTPMSTTMAREEPYERW